LSAARPVAAQALLAPQIAQQRPDETVAQGQQVDTAGRQPRHGHGAGRAVIPGQA
jgi:hypothetical protein